MPLSNFSPRRPRRPRNQGNSLGPRESHLPGLGDSFSLRGTGRWVRELWLDLLAILWPCACVVCEAPDRDLCAECRERLHQARAAHSLTRIVLPAGVAAFVAGPYTGPLRAVMVAYKHGGRLAFARVLGAQLRAPLRAALSSNAHAHAHAVGGESSQPTLIVTAASRRSSVRERGYRHVDLLVKHALRDRANMPRAILVGGALRALRGRTGQVGLDAAERERNAARMELAPSMRGLLAGRDVVVVDDIVTTGATMRAAVAALTEAGARVVAIVAVCATERRDATLSGRSDFKVEKVIGQK
ncbi:MAG: ComF family protein [Leucobacter sp.]|nr:ComF family protein [Leucobacter sp.]